MSTTLNKTIITALAALLLLATGANAAPSLGLAKGKPYYGASQQSGGGFHAVRSYSPSWSVETRQSFSYGPADGVATVKSGCPQNVVKVPAAAKEEVAKAPQTTRRSFSYEPATRARNFRSTAPKKDPWLYPKGDRRRYGR
jgi:hypothetical protein